MLLYCKKLEKLVTRRHDDIHLYIDVYCQYANIHRSMHVNIIYIYPCQYDIIIPHSYSLHYNRESNISPWCCCLEGNIVTWQAPLEGTVVVYTKHSAWLETSITSGKPVRLHFHHHHHHHHHHHVTIEHILTEILDIFSRYLLFYFFLIWQSNHANKL